MVKDNEEILEISRRLKEGMINFFEPGQAS